MRLASQTAQTIWLKFFVDTQGWSGDAVGLKNLKFFAKFLFSWAMQGPLASFTEKSIKNFYLFFKNLPYLTFLIFLTWFRYSLVYCPIESAV